MRHDQYQRLHLKAAEAVDTFKIQLGRPTHIQNPNEATLKLLDQCTMLVTKLTEIVAEVNKELEEGK